MNIFGLVILQTVTLFGLSQIITYLLMILNFVYTIFVSAFVIPAYNDHKLIKMDYLNRTSPQAIELKRINDEKMVRYENDIKDILHKFNNPSQQIAPLLARMDNEPDMDELFKLMKDIKQELHNKQ